MMPKNFLLLVSVLTATALTVYSCKKDDGNDDHAGTATITIDTPQPDASFNTNDTVFIKGTITAEETLHGCDIYIRDKADNSSVFIADMHDHATTINVDTFWINTLSGDTTGLELEINATLDHDGNTHGKKVSFIALP